MPSVLHAALLEGELLLWAEDGTRPGAGTAPRPGRRRGGAPSAAPHGLRAAELLPLLPDLAAAAPRRQTAWAWLPSLQGRPLPSPLLQEGPQTEGNAALSLPELRPHPVETLALTPAAALPLLRRCGGGGALAPGLLPGADLDFWVAAARLAASLAARRAFLPGVEAGGGRYRACWRPLLSPGDQAAADALAQAMPGACRALARGPEAAPLVPARSVLDAFLASLVDHLPRGLGRGPGPAAARAPAFDSPHDQWLHALTAADGALAGSAAELGALASQAAEWAQPVQVRHDAAFRLCFRLQEPQTADGEGDSGPPDGGGGEGPWRVQYVLQASDDPSLLLSAEQVWPGRTPADALPRQALLAALGRAAALVPEVQRSLRGSQPSGYDLETSGAHGFLTETAGVLEQAGFGVLLPAWWAGRGSRARLVARAHARAPRLAGAAGIGLEALVEFDWEVALGDRTLSREELERLAQLKAPLVRVRGQWVQVNADEIAAALALWDGRASRRGTLRDALRLAAGTAAGTGELAAELGRTDGWLRELLGTAGEATGHTELAPPGDLRATLRPYQARGYSWLHLLSRRGLGACLADDMGLGKTIQTLALVLDDWARAGAAGARPVLLVCPTSVLGNWSKEAERFTPTLPVLLHHGPDRLRAEAFVAAAQAQAMVLTTYALLPRDLETLSAVAWRGVVLDEAQNVKNAETKQARAARALRADYRLALTGTPVENNVGDLWALLEFLNPGLLGTQAEFRRAFFAPIQISRDQEAAARLRRLTAPFILRRLKTDPAIVSDLPAKHEMKVYCTLTREQASLYGAVVTDLQRRLQDVDAEGGIARRGLILGALSKLKQVCNHPAHFLGDGSPLPGRSGKLERLTEMLEEALSAGDRALVFTQFTEMGELLQTHLRQVLGQEALFLHGGVPRTARERMVERFQRAEGGPAVFLLSLKAGGTGLNLTAANRVFHFDRWWNPAVENQATDRAFRLGQRRNVQVHKFVCAGTVEERIDAMLEGKREIAEQVVGSGEAWLTELSGAELRDLLALRPGAVED